jgi:hypothetical protein
MEETKYQVTYLPKFSQEFENFPLDQQDSILDFTDIFEELGLSDFSKYDGKITPSWKNLEPDDPKYIYTRENHLWHYHVGIPEYKNVYDKYKTSDMVLHFQWFFKGDEINLVDMYYHYTNDGEFYLPPEAYLTT